MKEKSITALSIALIIYGVFTFLFLHLLIGSFLLFLNLKKYNIKKWLVAFSVLYLIIGFFAFVMSHSSSEIPYIIICIILSLVFWGLSRSKTTSQEKK